MGHINIKLADLIFEKGKSKTKSVITVKSSGLS